MTTPDRLDEIKARASAATPGPWRWEGNTDFRRMSLATGLWGRWVVMGFDRWGMHGAQPTFADGRKVTPNEHGDITWESFATDGRLTKAEHLPRFEVCPSATSRKDDRVYRADLIGIRNPDAEFIANSRADVEWLLAEVDRLRAKVAEEKNWNDAIDWLLNSRHTGDSDIQTAFWGMTEGKLTRDQADAGVFKLDENGDLIAPGGES